MITCFAQLKGGVGKTSLAIHFAAELALNGSNVLLLDADTQASALRWSKAREEESLFTVVSQTKAIFHREAARMIHDFDHIVIDLPPHTVSITKSALSASDLCVLPVTPSPYDIWALESTADIVTQAGKLKPLRSAIVLNRVIVGGVMEKDARGILSLYENIPILETTIGNRVTFPKAAAEGKVVQETESTGKAAAEIRAFVKEATK